MSSSPTHRWTVALLLLLAFHLTLQSSAQTPSIGPAGKRPAAGPGASDQGFRGGHGPAHHDDARHQEGPAVAHYPLKNHEKIRRSVVETPVGVETAARFDDPQVAAKIQEHASWMQHRLERAQPSATTSADAASPSLVGPAIANFGKVFPLPQAVHQPRDGSKILVDVTKGGDPARINPAIEKAARFVNIYSGAGAKPAKASIALVLHGDATLAILRPDAYVKRFGGKENPNRTCLQQLQKNGVKIYVCGQSLLHKGGKPDEVLGFVDVAVSGLTAMVNLQQDGYGYIPLK